MREKPDIYYLRTGKRRGDLPKERPTAEQSIRQRLTQTTSKYPLRVVSPELENVGNGVALNVSTDPLFVDVLSIPELELGEPNMTFESIPVINKNQRLVVDHRSWGNSRRGRLDDISEHMDWMRHLRTNVAEK